MFHSKNITGKQSPVIIMDATTKLGMACARVIAEKGGNLVLLTHGTGLDDNLKDSMERASIQYITVDTEPWDETGMADLMEVIKKQFGGIHGFIYNYFKTICGGISKITEEMFHENYCKNIKAPFFTTQLVASYIDRTEAGKMIFMTSIQDEKPSGKNPLYSMAMAAIKNMSREAALAYGPDGTASIVIELGLPEQAAGIRDSRFSTFFDGYSYKIPLCGGRNEEEAARMCTFLLSDDCGFLNGAEIRMDGGAMLHYLDDAVNHRAILGGGDGNG